MPRPSLDQIFQGTAAPVPLYQPANENDRNATIADVFEPKRPSLDDIFAQPQPQIQQASQQPDTRFMAPESGFEHAGILPFKTNTKTGENVWWDNGFVAPEFIRSPVRGIQDLEAGAQQAQETGMPTMTQDSVSAMMSMMPFVGNIPTEGGMIDALKPNQPPPGSPPPPSFLKSNSSEPFPLAPQMPTPSSAQVREFATQRFQQGDAQGGMLKPHITNAWADKALQALPQSEEAKTVFGKESPITQMVDRIQMLRGKPLSLQGTLEIEQGLGDLVENNVNPATGKTDATGNQYLELQHSLRDLWQNATEADTIGGKGGFDAAKEGRELWAQSAKMNDIERIQNRANGTQNPAQAIRTAMNNLTTNPARTRGWSPEELAAGKASARAGIVSHVIKMGSNRFVAPVVGSVIGGPIGTAIGAGVAESANGLLNSRQNARLGNVLDIMTSRPVVQRAMTQPPDMPLPSESPPPPMLALPAPDLTNITNGYGQIVPLTRAGRQSIGQMQATHNPAASFPQSVTSPSELLQQYGNARLFDADKLPPITYRPGNPGALGNAEYLRLQQIADAQRGATPTNAITTQSVTFKPTTAAPLPYKDYLAQAQKILNQAAARGEPMKNTDMAQSLAEALMNMKRRNK